MAHGFGRAHKKAKVGEGSETNYEVWLAAPKPLHNEAHNVRWGLFSTCSVIESASIKKKDDHNPVEPVPPKQAFRILISLSHHYTTALTRQYSEKFKYLN